MTCATTKEMISKEKYFSTYESPNILIIPTSTNVPPFKQIKNYNETIYGSKKKYQENILKSDNVVKNENLSDISVPISDSHLNQIIEIKPCNLDKSAPKSEKKINDNIKPKVKTPDYLRTTKYCDKEQTTSFCYLNKSKVVKRMSSSSSGKNDKSSKELTNITSLTSNKNDLQHNTITTNKSENCKKLGSKLCLNNNTKNKNEPKKSKSVKLLNKLLIKKSKMKNCDTNNKRTKDVKLNYSSPKPNTTQQEIKCNKNKLIKSNVIIKEMSNKKSTCAESKTYVDKKINIDILKMNLTSSPKKSNLHRQKEAQAKVNKNNKKNLKMSKKIKIVINVMYKDLCGTKKTEEITSPQLDKNVDLTFLDDFDIDEVVESLYSCENTKESTVIDQEVIKNKNGIGHVLKEMKKSHTLSKKPAEGNAKFTESIKKSKKNEKTKIKQDIISRDFKLVEHNVTNSGPVIKTKVYDQIIHAKFGKILQSDRNQVTETHMESKVFDTKCPIEKFVISSNSSRKISQNLSIMKTEKTTVKEVVKIKQEKINDECSLVIKNEYDTKSNELTALKLETMIFDTLMEKYAVNSLIHCGKFSKIFKCTNLETGKFYAVKMLNRKCSYMSMERKKEKMLREIQEDIPLENLSCIYLISCFELENCWCFMTNYYPTNLQQVLQNDKKSFDITQIHKLSMQLVQAVIILRNKNIVHSDIRPGHILLNSDNDELKLCGFDGAYCYPNSNNVSPNMGTVNYRSPEIILGYNDGFSIDVWSTALVMYEMVSCSKLFMGETNNEILYKQICIFGNLPYNMIMQSRFKKYYFKGTTFVRTETCDEKKIGINNLGNCSGIKSIIFNEYKKRWGEITLKNDALKLHSFCSLLQKMLYLDPSKRLPIEYVYANTFFLGKKL